MAAMGISPRQPCSTNISILEASKTNPSQGFGDLSFRATSMVSGRDHYPLEGRETETQHDEIATLYRKLGSIYLYTASRYQEGELKRPGVLLDEKGNLPARFVNYK